jgi:uncharacterized protein YjbI with pentapeptide repeats
MKYLAGPELNNVLTQHRDWLLTKGRRGKRAKLVSVGFNAASFTGIDLSGVVFIKVDMQDCTLEGVNFNGSTLLGSSFIKAQISNCSFKYADMDECNLSEATIIGCDLTDADLAYAVLEKVIFENTTFTNTNFFGTNLRSASLSLSDLHKINFQNARLDNCNFIAANLTEANLSETSLLKTDFTAADMREANLFGVKYHTTAKFVKTVFSDPSVLDELHISKKGIIFKPYNKTSRDTQYDFEEERSKRNENAEKHFNVKEEGYITFSLPDSYMPAQLGTVLIQITLLYEGVRLALTAPFDSIGELLQKSLKPELYGAYKDKYALKTSKIEKGSWVGELVGKKGITGAVLDIFNMRQDYKLKKLEVKEKEATIDEGRVKAVVDAHHQVNEDRISEINALTPVLDSDGASEELKKAIENRISQLIGTPDHIEERTKVAIEVIDHVSNNLGALIGSQGGDVKIDGTALKFLPIKDDDNSDN